MDYFFPNTEDAHKIVSAEEGPVSVAIINNQEGAPGATLFLDPVEERALGRLGFKLVGSSIPSIFPWLGDLYAATDIAGLRIQVLRTPLVVPERRESIFIEGGRR